jgi:site-specific DNA recombinase
MKNVFAYVRVSTQKQGTQGSSLQEQRASISAYAERYNLSIAQWFEEMETAAKRGRPQFRQMIQGLDKGVACGVVIHKIDRSARNLRDWADLGDLIDRGVEVHFAHESLDLHSRGGRLSADIQAVVAADFIRNLRQEVKKGFYGRLKQGFYPLQAPTGYRDMGKAKAKEIDPVQGPLVRQAFELYASGEFSFDRLREEMHRRGLRGRNNCLVSRNTFTAIFNNPFYLGLMHIKSTGETFQGLHAPLIGKTLFDRVQLELRGNRPVAGPYKNDFLFRGMIVCDHCGQHLTGERQKKRYIYYRCHNRKCETVCINERAIDDAVAGMFECLQLKPDELRDLRDIVDVLRGSDTGEKTTQEGALKLQLAKCDERISRLTDTLIDAVIDKEVYDLKKTQYLKDRIALIEQLEAVTDKPSRVDKMLKNFELANTAYIQYKNGIDVERRDLIRSTISNFVGVSNYPAITLKSPFKELIESRISQHGAPCRDSLRTRVSKILAFLGGLTTEEIDSLMRKRQSKHGRVRAGRKGTEAHMKSLTSLSH